MQQTSVVNRPIAVSLKSRGLIAYEYRAGQLRDYMNNALLDISDISIAIVTDVSELQPAAVPKSLQDKLPVVTAA
jgi:hypothetical protein